MSIKNKNKGSRMNKDKGDRRKENESQSADGKLSILYLCAIFFIGAGFGSINLYHVSTMFENDTHFSHLSTLEREMSFRSEMGLYYSYYKTLVEADTFAEGYYKITHDNLTEYPDTIDTLQRFNLYPEVAIAYLYRQFIHQTSRMGITTKECWSVERGSGQRPITSCEGLGDPAYFYLESVWICSSLTVFILFVYSVYLSGSVVGGMMSVAFFFFNHSDATRVQWTPPLRENFAFPFVLLQMFTVTYITRHNTRMSDLAQGLLTIVTSWFCLVLWQFSQFFLSTQVVALFILCQLRFLPRNALLNLTFAHVIAICLSVVSMHGNKLLVSSIHLSLSASVFINTILWKEQSCNEGSLFAIFTKFILDSAMVVCLTIFMKTEGNSMMANKDDMHIVNIFKSKFTNYKDFHTLIYTCAPEFDFLPMTTVYNLACSYLLPTVCMVLYVVVYSWFQKDFKGTIEDEISVQHQNRLKNYAIEDYFEKNAITLKQMKSKDMEGKIEEVLENLEKCDYNYEEFSKTDDKTSLNTNTKVRHSSAKMEFLKNIEQLKSEISKKDKGLNINNEKQNCEKKKLNDNNANRNQENAKKATKPNNQNKSTATDKSLLERMKTYSLKVNAEPDVLYNILQMFAFIIMAVLIMRLKLFMTPHLCIMGSLIVSKRYFKWFEERNRLWSHTAIVVLVIISMSVYGIQYVRNQRAILGEYSNAPLEQMLTWVNDSTPPNAVFAGPMPIMAAVLLSTRRPIVNHPHYENAQLRERTKMVYSIFSRKTTTEVYNILSRLQVQYVILDSGWCFKDNAQGCKLVDLWDSEEPNLRNEPAVCPQLFMKKPIESFQRVFENSVYVILKLHSNLVNVELKPRQLREYSI